MAEVKIKFSAETAEAQKQLEELNKTGERLKKRLAEGGSGDRRGDLETLRTAKQQLAAVEAEKKEIQEKIRLQSQVVKEAQRAVDAAEEGTKEHRSATRELEKQRSIMTNLTSLGKTKGQAVDAAQFNVGMARQAARIRPQVDPAPAVSGFAKIRAAANSTVSRIRSGFASASAGISKAFSGMTAAVGAALAYIGINSVKSVINELDNLSKHARSMDIDTASFQKLKYAADSNNISFEQVESSIGKMKRSIGEAAQGSAEAQRKLATLGLTVKDFQGKSTAQQFDMIAQAITSIQDPAQRTAAAMQWFEEGGAKMMDFLRNYKQQGDELAARGAIIDDAQLKAAEEFNQALTNISTTLKGLAFNSGFMTKMSELVKLVDYAVGGKGEKNEQAAAAKGVYNRRTGTEFILNEMEKSGKYSPEQMQELRKAGKHYATGTHPKQYSEQYSVLDEELKARGMGALARQKGKWYQRSLVFDQDAVASPIQTKEEQAAEVARAKAEREKRQQEAAEAARKREAAQNAELQKKLDEQVAALDGTPSVKADEVPQTADQQYTVTGKVKEKRPADQKRQEFIQGELAKAEKTAATMNRSLTEPMRQQITAAAGAKYDRDQQGKSAKIDDEIAELERKYKLQQMINQGKGKEAAIEEALARARKQAEGSGTKLSQEQEERIRKVTGASYDLSHPAKNSAASARKLPDMAVVTNSLTSRGGFAGGAVSVSKDQYNRTIAAQTQRSTDILTEINRKFSALSE